MEEQNNNRICNWKMYINRENCVRFLKAIGKYRQGITITSEDLLALITKTKLLTDATNGKSFPELALQLENQKHQVNDFVEDINQNTEAL
jgi:hypothetical protein